MRNNDLDQNKGLSGLSLVPPCWTQTRPGQREPRGATLGLLAAGSRGRLYAQFDSRSQSGLYHCVIL